MTRFRRLRFARVSTALALGIAALVVPIAAHAASCKAAKCRDTVAPTVAISTPNAGATVGGSVTIAGSSSDNVGVGTVSVAIDGGSWQPAAGTTSWSWTWPTSPLGNGAHTVAARASDRSGNATVTSETVMVSNTAADTTAPTVTIAAPSSGATVTGTVDVTGSAADNAAVSSVQVTVDGGLWQGAAGTTSWTWAWDTTALPNGSHSVAVRVSDSSGNVATRSESVTVSNADTSAPAVTIAAPSAGAVVTGTVDVTGSASDNDALSSVAISVDGGGWQPASGTTSWSWSWNTAGLIDGSHTIAARVTDGSGNVTTRSESVSVQNGSTEDPQTWVSPEGVTIRIQTAAGGWTPDRIYTILTSGARDLAKIGPGLTIVVQNQQPTMTSMAASSVNGVYTSLSETMQLDARSTSTFSLRPDDILTHEFGHVWVNYYRFLRWQGDWSTYLKQRWTATDGSTTLATDSRTDTSYIWSPDEIAADDYRLLFGSSLAISERNASLNQQIVDPRKEPGLRDWFLTTWAG